MFVRLYFTLAFILYVKEILWDEKYEPASDKKEKSSMSLSSLVFWAPFLDAGVRLLFTLLL
jgi:hypothetical protein